jgi:hypothetical protein
MRTNALISSLPHPIDPIDPKIEPHLHSGLGVCGPGLAFIFTLFVLLATELFLYYLDYLWNTLFCFVLFRLASTWCFFTLLSFFYSVSFCLHHV